jgi:hypothetical protein
LEDNGNDIVEADGELIDGFPEDIPVYPGAEIEDSSQTSYEGKTGYTASWTTKGSVPVVMKWYGDQAKKNKWTIVESPSNPESKMEQHVWYDRDGLRINIEVESEEDENDIEISIDVLPS